MLNSHQILPGARTRGTIKTYVDADYGADVAFTGSGTGNFTISGTIELDGVPFGLSNLDISTIVSQLPAGEYVVGAVPAYTEPADRAAAATANVNYYVTDTALGETQVHYFLPAALETDVMNAGGHLVLAKRRNMGTATRAELLLLNRYEDELEKLSDPRYVGQLLEPTGVEYILKRVTRQDNSSSTDALAGMTNQEIELFKATQGYIAARRVVDNVANTVSSYETSNMQAKVKRAYAYASVADANADVNGVEVLIEDYADRTDIFSNPRDLNDNAISNADAGAYAVFELYQPTYMSRGHYGTQPAVEKVYTRDEFPAILGRINPIYLANDMTVARASFNRARPLGALTRYAHPLVVGRFISNGTTLTSGGTYTPGIIQPTGAPAGGTTPGFNN